MTMPQIRILQLLPGAREAQGITVIIDVFRACSTACYVIGNGARGILAVGSLERAYELKRRHPSFLLMGERHGDRPPDFDYGNSPTEIENVDLTDRTVIHTTSAGTQGLVNAQQAEELLTGSFCNAGAIVAYLRARQPALISLVCMGEGGREPSDEDTLCAQYIQAALEGAPLDFDRIRDYLRTYETARKFFDPGLLWAPERDFDLCLALNRFDFVLQARPEAERVFALTKIYAHP